MPNDPSGTMPPPFSAENQPAPLSPEEKALRRKLAKNREERITQLKDNLADLALNAEHETTRVNATVAWLNREEGMPTQRSELNVRRNITDFTDEELDSIARGSGGADGAGEAPRSTH